MMAMDYAKLDKKYLTDDAGEGVLVTSVDLMEDRMGQAGELKAFLVVGGGSATAYLKNHRKPDDGVETLEEPIECSERVDLEKPDRKMFFDKLKRHFGLTDLVDTGDDALLRIVRGGDLNDKIVGKKVYFQLNVKPESLNDTKYGVKYFTNMASVPKRYEATQESVQEVLARLKAKRAPAGDLFGDGGTALAV